MSTIVTDGSDCRLQAHNIFRGIPPPNVKRRPVQLARDLFPSLEGLSLDRLASFSVDPGLGNMAVSTFSDPMTPTVIRNVRISQGSLLNANQRLYSETGLGKCFLDSVPFLEFFCHLYGKRHQRHQHHG